MTNYTQGLHLITSKSKEKGLIRSVPGTNEAKTYFQPIYNGSFRHMIHSLERSKLNSQLRCPATEGSEINYDPVMQWDTRWSSGRRRLPVMKLKI